MKCCARIGAKRRDFQAHAAQFHTTTSHSTELAEQAKPGLLILHHASLSLRPAGDSERSSPAASLNEVSKYSGRGVVGRDLDVYRAEKWRRGRDSNPRRDVMPSTDFESVPL
jgi:hypothetical protein